MCVLDNISRFTTGPNVLSRTGLYAESHGIVANVRMVPINNLQHKF